MVLISLHLNPQLVEGDGIGQGEAGSESQVGNSLSDFLELDLIGGGVLDIEGLVDVVDIHLRGSDGLFGGDLGNERLELGSLGVANDLFDIVPDGLVLGSIDSSLGGYLGEEVGIISEGSIGIASPEGGQIGGDHVVSSSSSLDGRLVLAWAGHANVGLDDLNVLKILNGLASSEKVGELSVDNSWLQLVQEGGEAGSVVNCGWGSSGGGSRLDLESLSVKVDELVEVEVVDRLTVFLKVLQSVHVGEHEGLVGRGGGEGPVVGPHGGNPWVWASRWFFALVGVGISLFPAAEASVGLCSWDLLEVLSGGAIFIDVDKI